jgi:hypothetical protein
MWWQFRRKICPVDYYSRVERREKLPTARPCMEAGDRAKATRSLYGTRRYHRAGRGGAAGERHGRMDPRLPHALPAPVELGLRLCCHRAGPPGRKACRP